MEKIIKAIIVDDEPLARKGLSIRLSDFTDIELVAECQNGEEALQAISELAPQLVFLDIQMPGMTGFEALERIQALELEETPLIVFVTAYDQYALQAFEVHAIDYLLKPVDDERLAECIENIRLKINSDMQSNQQEKLVELMAQITGEDKQTILNSLSSGSELPVKNYSSFISIKDVGETTRLPVNDVVWIDAAGDYMCVHCSDGETHILRKTMKQLEQELDPKRFIRVHRSVIVNSDEVGKVLTLSSGEYVLQLTNKHEIRVSRSYREKVRESLL
ncbi:MAG: response regulator transcription factor [Gammaproteobacteria bacterium]|nr:response regulator transcription factor [Gammaproteobacteria bacterium]